MIRFLNYPGGRILGECSSQRAMVCFRASLFESLSPPFLRAMLVMNCAVDLKRVLASPSGLGGNRGGQRGKKQRPDAIAGETGEGTSSSGTAPSLERCQVAGSTPVDKADRFHPVSCATCGTEVRITLTCWPLYAVMHA